jgi:hypothetical protein
MVGYVLYEDKVWILLRKDHYGDESIWHIRAIHEHAIWMRYVKANECIELDPALNILFEKET